MESIVVTRDRHIARVTLNHPDRHNAFVPSMWHRLGEIGEELVADPELRCVIIDGNGPSFSSGLDRQAFARGEVTPAELTNNPIDDEGRTQFLPGDLAAAHRSYRWLAEGPLISIAAVQGKALGAGAQLAYACDLRVLADDTTLRQPEITMGLIPDMGAMAYLPTLIGYSRALELLVTGRPLDAAEAMQLGLANQVVTRRDLATRVSELATRIGTSAPGAAGYIKQALRAGACGDIDGAFSRTDDGQVTLLNQPLGATSRFRNDATVPSAPDLGRRDL